MVDEIDVAMWLMALIVALSLMAPIGGTVSVTKGTNKVTKGGLSLEGGL